MQTGGNQTGNVSHIDNQNGTYFIGDFLHLGKVDDARIRRSAAHNQRRTAFLCLAQHFVVIQKLGFGIQEIGRASCRERV